MPAQNTTYPGIPSKTNIHYDGRGYQLDTMAIPVYVVSWCRQAGPRFSSVINNNTNNTKMKIFLVC